MTATIQEKIKNLFLDNKTVSALLITDYLHWAGNPAHYPLELALPPIQRGFVWKPKQIQDLWDSLMRGMPIGSIMLQASKCNSPSVSLSSVERIKEDKSCIYLVDGQQRTLAMLLGFDNAIPTDHRLWVDFSEAGKNGNHFQFRVSTASQPFGYRPDNGQRLPRNERIDARLNWESTMGNKEWTNRDIFNNPITRPWKAGGKQHEYIFEVKYLWNWLNDNWIDIIKTEITRVNKEAIIDEQKLTRIKNFGVALIAIQAQWVALIKIPDTPEQKDIEDPSHDYLTMLFERISSGGTRLTPDELLFSMVKQSWPEAHNIVYKLQGEVGSLMKPTDFVMTAFRLAALQSNEIKAIDPELNAKTFHNNLGTLLGNNTNPGVLRKMIDKEKTLINAFKILIDLIKYRGDGDHGIPSTMFPYLNVYMLQVILSWIIKNNKNSISMEDSRDDVLRFLLFWFVCSGDNVSSYQASKKAIEIISESFECFPAGLIYQKLTHKDENKWSIFQPLILPPKNNFKGDRFRSQQEREKHHFEESYLLYTNFTTRTSLLLWLQRKWVESMYGEFIPTAGQDEDNVPYDFDHLVPQSNWSSFYSITRNIKNKESSSVFENPYHRRVLGNSIGNYRVMESSVNRKRQDDPLAKEQLQPKEYWGGYALNSCDIDEFKNWMKASPEKSPLNWDDDRLLAFQFAVESRVIYLYERYIKEAKLDAWL